MRLMIKCLVFLILFSSYAIQAEEGLDVYYDFETDEAKDQSGNGRDGEIAGKPVLIDGAVGKAWEFDGGTVINMNFDIMKAADPELSIRCFIKPEELAGQHIIYDEGGAWTGFTVRIMDGNIEFATVCCDQNHPPFVVVSSELPDTDEWIDIAAVFGKGKMILYVDEQKVGEEDTEWDGLGAHGQAGGIGHMSPGDTAFGGGGAFFIGGIDEFRVYSRMLQPEEIRTAVALIGKLAVTWGSLRDN
jgi:hypothetical protein